MSPKTIPGLCFALWLAIVNVECRKIVDLTHTFDGAAPKWPLNDYIAQDQFFKQTDLVEERMEYFWLSVKKFEYYEHMGTHIDAPIHTAEGRLSVDQIPVHKLIGPGVVLDIKQKAQQNPDYSLTVADIEAHEEKFGRIPDEAVVVINSGWHTKYPRADLIFGTDMINDSSTFHFPGYSLEAAQFLLVQRRVKTVGIDTPSIDIAQEAKLLAHVYLQSHDVPLLEYVAHLDSIPQVGTTIFIGAPKFRDGTGGPTRVMAVIDDHDDGNTSDAVSLGMPFCCMLFGAIIGLIFY